MSSITNLHPIKLATIITIPQNTLQLIINLLIITTHYSHILCTYFLSTYQPIHSIYRILFDLLNFPI